MTGETLLVEKLSKEIHEILCKFLGSELGQTAREETILKVYRSLPVEEKEKLQVEWKRYHA